jgi:NADH-quinone oxidoreductase subunit J
MIADLVFYMCAALLIMGGIGVVTARNPMIAIIFMVMSFFNAAGIFLLLGAEFIALLTVMVYVGAVAVMFLFVLMTIDIDFEVLKDTSKKHLPLGVLVIGIMLSQIILGVFSGVFKSDEAAVTGMPIPEGGENITHIGNILFTDYLLPFQACGFILLTAMIGAIVLTYRKRPDSKRQVIGKQVSRTREESMVILDVPKARGTAEMKPEEVK